jgi:hypothetical protein
VTGVGFDVAYRALNKITHFMYKGFTRPEYRGQRLHAVAMANALMECAKEGRRGLVCFVEANNFNALKSCYRMAWVFGRSSRSLPRPGTSRDQGRRRAFSTT